VASIAYTTTGEATITFKENMGVLLSAVPTVQTATGTAPVVLPTLGTYTQNSKTLVIQATDLTTLGTPALINPTASHTFYVSCRFSADVRD
jgi:hypothetical protein